MNNVIYSDDLYNKHLFTQGEKLWVNASGTLEITPKESYWNRFKRFITFGQNPHIDAVHNRMEILANEINNQSSPLFTSLADEVHTRGIKKFKCLESNLIRLREKLDHVGHTNVFSSLILRIANLFRALVRYPAIALKTYATITYHRPQVWWMADHFWSNTNKVTTSSFSMRLGQMEKVALDLRATDIVDSDLDLQNRNELYSLERGLTDYWNIEHIYKNFNTKNGTQQILINLEITYDPLSKHFKAAIRNPRGSIPDDLANTLKQMPDDDRSVSFYIYYDQNGQNQIHELNWIITPEGRSGQLIDGSKSFILEPDVTYSFTDEAGKALERFSYKMK